MRITVVAWKSSLATIHVEVYKTPIPLLNSTAILTARFYCCSYPILLRFLQTLFSSVGRRLSQNTTMHSSSAASPASEGGTGRPQFDLALVSFSCAYRLRHVPYYVPSTAGRLYVTATHLAFVPLLFGRRVAIHLDRIQCLVRREPTQN